MAGKRIEIMELRQLITLKKKGLSNRRVADLLRMSRNTVSTYTRYFEANGLDYDVLLSMDDHALLDLFGVGSESHQERYEVLSGYFSHFENELRKPGCRLSILWQEYYLKHPDGYQYSQFCKHFRRWCNKVKGSCKLTHKAGEKLFIDFTGKKLPVINRQTGETEEMNVFVGILPSSQYTFVKAVRTQSKEDLIHCLGECLAYFGGSPQVIVSDNLKAAVDKYHKHSPKINKTLNDFALYYGCVVDPARPYHPQDKALVEGAVKLVYQRIFYPLSKYSIFTLEDLNKEILVLLEVHNNMPFSQSKSTRRADFLDLESSFLQPLPSEPYTIRHFKRIKVQKMGYAFLSEDKHYYSVPYRFIGCWVEVSYTQTSVEISYNKQRLCSHRRSFSPGKYSTNADHLSSSHQAYTQWSLEFFQERATKIGEATHRYITELIEQCSYPEIGYKQAMGILILTKQYTNERLEKACIRALLHPKRTYQTVELILKNKMEDHPILLQNTAPHISSHENIRGAQAYQ